MPYFAVTNNLMNPGYLECILGSLLTSVHLWNSKVDYLFVRVQHWILSLIGSSPYLNLFIFVRKFIIILSNS